MRPFSNGTQFMDWQEANCERCKKGTADGWPTCEIEAALVEALIGDGHISDDMAHRMGINEETKNMYNWPCGEVERCVNEPFRQALEQDADRYHPAVLADIQAAILCGTV